MSKKKDNYFMFFLGIVMMLGGLAFASYTILNGEFNLMTVGAALVMAAGITTVERYDIAP